MVCIAGHTIYGNTNYFLGEKLVARSSVKPVLKPIRHLMEADDADPELASIIKVNTLKHLDLKLMNGVDVYGKSSFLDPRFKGHEQAAAATLSSVVDHECYRCEFVYTLRVGLYLLINIFMAIVNLSWL